MSSLADNQLSPHRLLVGQPSKSNPATDGRVFWKPGKGPRAELVSRRPGPPCRGTPSPLALLSLLLSLSAPHNITKASSTCLLTCSSSTPYSGELPRQAVEKRTHLCRVPGQHLACDLQPLRASMFSHVK